MVSAASSFSVVMAEFTSKKLTVAVDLDHRITIKFTSLVSIAKVAKSLVVKSPE